MRIHIYINGTGMELRRPSIQSIFDEEAKVIHSGKVCKLLKVTDLLCSAARLEISAGGLLSVSLTLITLSVDSMPEGTQ